MPNHLLLYKSADFKIIITVSFDPLDGFGQSKSHFGVVFQGKSSDEVKSAVQLYKSADRKAKLVSIEIYTMELHMSKVKLG